MDRKMTVGDVLDASFRMYRQSFTIFLGLGAIYVPVALGTQLMTRSYTSLIMEPSPASVLILLALLLVSGILGAVYSAAVCAASFKAFRGEKPALRSAVALGFARCPVVVLAGLIEIIALMFGFVMCFVPGFILLTVFGLYLPAAVIERRGPFAALGRSGSLTEGSRWRTLWVLVLPGIIVSVLQGFVTVALVLTLGIQNTIGVSIAANVLTNWRWCLYVAVAAVAGAVFGPIGSIPQTVLFMALRDEKEGAELEHRVESLSADPLEGEPAKPGLSMQ